MTRILFVAIPEKGHINPLIGPALALQAKGAQVAFYSARDIGDHLSRAGITLSFCGLDGSPPAPDANRGQLFARRVADNNWLRQWIKELLIDSAEDQIEPLRKVVRQFRPDVMVIDPMIYSAIIVAHQESIPWAGVSSSLNPVIPANLTSELIATNAWLSPARQALFAKHGLEPTFSVCDCLSSDLNIVFSTEQFVGRMVPGVHLVGPSMPAGPRGDECSFPWERLRTDVPIIYMSLGSQIYYQPDFFKTVITAVKDKPVQLVASVSELLHTEHFKNVSKNVLLCQYTPQLKLLPRCAAFISHGGANSIMEAMALNVPVLISPICNDQSHQAFFLEQSGCGIHLDLSLASPTECWSALSKLINPGIYRENVERVYSSYRQQDGAQNAATLIEQLIVGKLLAQGPER